MRLPALLDHFSGICPFSGNDKTGISAGQLCYLFFGEHCGPNRRATSQG